MISIRNHIYKTGCWLRNRPNLPTYLPNPSKSRCLYPLKPVLNSIKPVIEKFNGKYVEKLGIEGHLQENFYPKKEGHGPRRKLIYLPTSYIWSDFEIINAAWFRASVASTVLEVFNLQRAIFQKWYFFVS